MLMVVMQKCLKVKATVVLSYNSTASLEGNSFYALYQHGFLVLAIMLVLQKVFYPWWRDKSHRCNFIPMDYTGK